MDHVIFNVCTAVNAYDCARECADTVRESALKADCGRKSLATTGNWACIRSMPVQCFANWATSSPQLSKLVIKTRRQRGSNSPSLLWTHHDHVNRALCSAGNASQLALHSAALWPWSIMSVLLTLIFSHQCDRQRLKLSLMVHFYH